MGIAPKPSLYIAILAKRRSYLLIRRAENSAKDKLNKNFFTSNYYCDCSIEQDVANGKLVMLDSSNWRVFYKWVMFDLPQLSSMYLWGWKWSHDSVPVLVSPFMLIFGRSKQRYRWLSLRFDCYQSCSVFLNDYQWIP